MKDQNKKQLDGSRPDDSYLQLLYSLEQPSYNPEMAKLLKQIDAIINKNKSPINLVVFGTGGSMKDNSNFEDLFYNLPKDNEQTKETHKR